MSTRTIFKLPAALFAVCLAVLAWSPVAFSSQIWCETGDDAPLKLRVTVPESRTQEFVEFLRASDKALAQGAWYVGGAESDRNVFISFVKTLNRETESTVTITARNQKPSRHFDFTVSTCNTDESWKPYMAAVRARVGEFGDLQISELPSEDAQQSAEMLLPDRTPAQQRNSAEVARELGVVLAWQMTPSLWLEWCRGLNPEGVNARQDLFDSWRDRNQAVLANIDSRVAEVVPLVRPSTSPAASVQIVRDQVKKILNENFSRSDAAEKLEVCKSLSNPAENRWSGSSLQSVQQSLAALYDWQVENNKPASVSADLNAWAAAAAMGKGVNIGNTLENTTQWETGWGNPRITRELIDSLKAMGFTTVRVPVAWDTFAKDGKVQPDKMARVAEVVDWITAAGMYCVINIHWDGGWIDSSNKEKFAKTHATFSADAERKFVSYWTQIADHFKGRNQLLVFEGLNEETNFEGTGSMKQAYETLTHVNQLFIDTVRQTGGNNAKRLLIVTGYGTDITKTTHKDFELPVDSVPDRMMLSVHYYTPWQFAGMTKDESWGKVQHTWGSAADVAELNRLFDAMQEFSKRHDIPVFVGEFGVTDQKEKASRVRWMSAVAEAALSRKMVPVLWDTGGDVSRKQPYGPSPALREVMKGSTNSK